MPNYCIDCGKEISAKATRCGHCANIKSWDRRGRTPVSHCIECNKEIGRDAARCRKCSGLSKKPPNFCLDCGKEIGYSATRCRVCSNKSRSKPKDFYYCIDCNKEITKGAKRCWHCFTLYMKTKEWRTQQSLIHMGQKAWNAGTAVSKPDRYCKDCGAKIKSIRTNSCRSCSTKRAWADPEQREYHTKCIREANKDPERRKKISKKLTEAWARGDFDNAFQSPTQPELDVMAALDDLGIDYVPQYRIESYLYDVYLANLGILIEYDGWRWHHSDWAIANGTIERDKHKDILANKRDLKLIRLKGLPNHDLTYDEIYLQLSEELADGSP